MSASEPTAVILIAHGTVEHLDDLPRFLTNIRRGHPAPPELIHEVRRRYEAIGGRSPLVDITRELASKLERELALPTRVAMRLFEPYPKEILLPLAAEGIRRFVTLPLAQHSASIYASAVYAAAREIDPTIEVLSAKNWGRTPELTQAYADAIEASLQAIPDHERDKVTLLLTAHSLPVAIVRGGDPYEDEFRQSAADVVAELRRRGAQFAEHAVSFQSQGMGGGVEWLGPDLRKSLDAVAARKHRHAVIAPIGFLADHVEILYDLDIEARSWCDELGLILHRTASLNAGAGLVRALAHVARGVLASPIEHRVTAAPGGRPQRPGPAPSGTA
jgi:ferrochelatase